MFELSKQDDSLHVAFLASRDVMDRYDKLLGTTKIEQGIVAIPPELRDVLRTAGKEAGQLSKKLEAKRKALRSSRKADRARALASGNSEGAGPVEDTSS